MDSFAVVIIGLVLLVLIAVVLLGVFYPGSGADQLDWKPTRSPELEAQNEIDDLEQMQAAINAKRRARGAEEITERDVRDRLDSDRREQQEMLDREMADAEIDELLAMKNRRRRSRGQAEITREEYERSLRDPGAGR
ncbi:MAG: hypothetical protein FGM34_00090 [Solirubrobacteraceae bacterium]|nr:hypothetical protein [Solirubrobacteraceae bacterium]